MTVISPPARSVVAESVLPLMTCRHDLVAAV